MPRKIDIAGKVVGKITVLYENGKDKAGNIRWFCKCNCGNYFVTTGRNIHSGKTQSCGCLRKEVTSKAKKIHGQSNSGVYRAWAEMRSRCTNPNSTIYKYYGGRGIIICSRWNEFTNFFADMGKRPKDLTLERIDNNGNYEPFNCKWATRKEQSRNSRHNRIITYKHKSQCMVEWAEEFDINYGVLQRRLNKHSVEIAFNM